VCGDDDEKIKKQNKKKGKGRRYNACADVVRDYTIGGHKDLERDLDQGQNSLDRGTCEHV
jgi:hypothetical protein